MAVYTKLQKADLEQLLENYDIGQLQDFSGIISGVENTNYLIKTSQNKFILTIYEKRVNIEELPFFIDLMRHVSEKNIPCPTPIADKNAKIIQDFSEKKLVISSFLEGNETENISNENCAKLGEMLAKPHLATESFSGNRENSIGVNSFFEIAQPLLARSGELSTNLKDFIIQGLEKVKSWPKNLPNGVIHADLFPDNVFFKNQEVSGLLNFYFACNDFYAYDLAICINAWCFEKNFEFNITKTSNLIKSYQKIRKLNGQELEFLPVLCAGSALRFLLSRLHDWQNRVAGADVKLKDPLEYMKKLEFHLQVQNHNQYLIS